MKGLGILGKLDREYMLSSYEHAVRNKWFERYFKDIIAYNTENLHSLRGEHFVGLSNHLSHSDYMLFGKLFLENLDAQEFPRIIAGKNLDSKILSLIGLNFKRMNSFFIDREIIASLEREERKAYLERISRRIKRCLKNYENFWDFPEGGRSRNGEILESIKTGFFASLIESGTDPWILCSAIDYDYVIERNFFPIIEWAKNKKSFRWLYYLTDISAFLFHPFLRENRGNVYVNFRKPKRLSEILQSEAPRKQRGEIISYITKEIRVAYQEIQDNKRPGEDSIRNLHLTILMHLTSKANCSPLTCHRFSS